MNRREFLVAGGGAAAAVGGGTAVARATRADILVETGLTRGAGEAAEIGREIDRESVTLLESTNEVRENGQTRPFEAWARSECAEIGAEEVVSVVAERLATSVDGVGSGVRSLLFGPVVTVDHTTTRERDGSVESEPDVSVERLLSVAPRTLTITITLEGRRFTKSFPVAVGQNEVSAD